MTRSVDPSGPDVQGLVYEALWPKLSTMLNENFERIKLTLQQVNHTQSIDTWNQNYIE